MNNLRIDRSTFETIKDHAVRWVRRRFCRSVYWRSVAELHAQFRKEQTFCYEADFFEFCKLAGLQVYTDGQGNRWVRAEDRGAAPGTRTRNR